MKYLLITQETKESERLANSHSNVFSLYFALLMLLRRYGRNNLYDIEILDCEKDREE